MTTLEKIKSEIEAVEPKSHVQYGMRWADTTLMIPFHKVMQIIDRYAEQEPRVKNELNVELNELKPCEDAVSRAEVVKKLHRIIPKLTSKDANIIVETIIGIEKLPSVNPMYKHVEPTQKSVENTLETRCEDAVSRQAVLDALMKSADAHAENEREWQLLLRDRNIIRELPSVQPKEKTGRWICIDDYHIGKFKCSVCQTEGFPNTVMYKPTWNYCPNCGSDMRGEE